MTLVDMLKNTGKVLALAALPLYSGCAEIAGEVIEGEYRVEAAQIQRDGQIRAAQIQGGQQTQQFNTGLAHGHGIEDANNMFIASYNYSKDFNGNDAIDYPAELVGRKQIFSISEKITVVLSFLNGKRFSQITYKLFDDRGDVVDEVSHCNTFGAGGIYNLTPTELRLRYQDGNVPKGRSNDLREGEYRAVWTAEGKFIATHDFKVFKSREEIAQNK